MRHQMKGGKLKILKELFCGVFVGHEWRSSKHQVTGDIRGEDPRLIDYECTNCGKRVAAYGLKKRGG